MKKLLLGVLLVFVGMAANAERRDEESRGIGIH